MDLKHKLSVLEKIVKDGQEGVELLNETLFSILDSEEHIHELKVIFEKSLTDFSVDTARCIVKYIFDLFKEHKGERAPGTKVICFDASSTGWHRGHAGRDTIAASLSVFERKIYIRGLDSLLTKGFYTEFQNPDTNRDGLISNLVHHIKKAVSRLEGQTTNSGGPANYFTSLFTPLLVMTDMGPSYIRGRVEAGMVRFLVKYRHTRESLSTHFPEVVTSSALASSSDPIIFDIDKYLIEIVDLLYRDRLAIYINGVSVVLPHYLYPLTYSSVKEYMENFIYIEDYNCVSQGSNLLVFKDKEDVNSRIVGGRSNSYHHGDSFYFNSIGTSGYDPYRYLYELLYEPMFTTNILDTAVSNIEWLAYLSDEREAYIMQEVENFASLMNMISTSVD